MKTRALIFDCDGVLADTEQFGHLPAFNRMWQDLRVPWAWSVEEYGRMLAISGGKERMRVLRDNQFFCRLYHVPEDEKEWDRVVAQWHQIKTAVYKHIVESGALPPRPGVKRLAQEAYSSGWQLAVCSTSNELGVRAVLNSVMGPDLAGHFLVLAGDVVDHKKPAPDIYLLAAARLGLCYRQCLVIEDSANGLTAAKTAGMHCLVTPTGYTADEDFGSADLVVSCLGDPGDEPCRVIANPSYLCLGSLIDLADLEAILAS